MSSSRAVAPTKFSVVVEGPKTEMPVAAIDIGTNSFHLVVARPTENVRFEILSRDKEVVRLGSGSGDMKRLDPKAIERGVAALARFRLIADTFGAEVHAVATSAVREAENRGDFLRAAQSHAAITVEVISGVEEARLIHLGVLQAVPVFEQQALVIDIGGGSTEFMVGRGSGLLDARSLKIGAIRLSERFFNKEPIKKKAVEEARTYIRSYLPPVARMVDANGGFEVAVGSSGTIQNIAEMVRAMHGEEPLIQIGGRVTKSIGNATFTAEELFEITDELLSRPRAADRLSVPGLDPRRADIIVGGVLVLEQAVRALQIDKMVVSDYALREGVLLDVLRRRAAGTLGHLRDLRYESVLHLARLAPGEREHCERISALALELFEGTRTVHGLSGECEEWLQAASLLCNVGLVISHDRHHLHSYYIIRNAELLTGFTDREIELIALVARYHRKSAPKDRHPEYVRLEAGDQYIVRVLAGILRIAASLDRTRSGAVRHVTVEGGSGHGPLQVLLDASPEAAALELYSANSRKSLLSEALGLPVEISVAET